RDRLEATLALGARPPHGAPQPVGAVDALGIAPNLRADVAAGRRIHPVARDGGDAAVLDLDVEAASIGTVERANRGKRRHSWTIASVRLEWPEMGFFASINGTIAPAEEARVSVLDNGFTFGDSVYETLRTYAGRPFALARHLRRLRASARRIDIDLTT